MNEQCYGFEQCKLRECPQAKDGTRWRDAESAQRRPNAVPPRIACQEEGQNREANRIDEKTWDGLNDPSVGAKIAITRGSKCNGPYRRSTLVGGTAHTFAMGGQGVHA